MGSLGEKLSPRLVSPDRDVPRPRGRAPSPASSTPSAAAACRRGLHRPRRPGYYKEDLTVEDVARQLGRRHRNEEGYTVPANLGEETAVYVKALR